MADDVYADNVLKLDDRTMEAINQGGQLDDRFLGWAAIADRVLRQQSR